ncbi:hypothetical protein C8R44DRAFT_209225 [Mycena epipterygia]|nr:hypothetical protein C8R44DRAFT_209225 [Mycena epipterygia]
MQCLHHWFRLFRYLWSALFTFQERPNLTSTSMRASGGVGSWLILSFFFSHIYFLSVQARLHERAKRNVIERRDPLSASGLASASWIWTSEATTGNVAFLKDFSIPRGKSPISATFTITVVNQFTLWVNGQPIGRSGNGTNDWQSAQVFSTALNSTNTFSVLAVNNANSGAPAPGLLAAIQVRYRDGSNDTIVSDSSWTVSAIIPSDFPTPSDTSHFVGAAVAAPFGTGSWANDVTVSSPDPNSLSLSGSTWIWATQTAISTAAVGFVAFRKTVTTPPGKTAQFASILITVDDNFHFYLNGNFVAAPPAPNWQHAQRFTAGLSAGSNTFTVVAQNYPNPNGSGSSAGVNALITIQYSDGSTDVVGTDTSWLSGNFTSVPAFLSTPDSALSETFALGTMGVSPWGQLLSTFNVLAAVDVPSPPFTNVGSSSPTGTANIPTSTSNGTGVPVALIVGAVVGGLALVVVGLVVFFWLRRRDALRRSRALRSQIFVSEFSVPPMSSLGVTMQQPPQVIEDEHPLPRQILPSSKLARESILWRSNAAASSSTTIAAPPAAEASVTAPSPRTAPSHPAPDPSTEIAPPSYWAQV